MENAAVTIELSDGTIKKSQTFIGKWNGLISTTNWEKGKIISQWRAALKDNNAPITEYSDEAWGQLVGRAEGLQRSLLEPFLRGPRLGRC